MVDRHEQRRLETRRRLLEAAEHVFGQKGYVEASVLDITEAADVSKRTFYLHFKDKENVIEALALRRFDQLRAQVEVPSFEEQHETFREGFERITTVIFEFAAENPDLMNTLFARGGSFRLQTLVREYMASAWEENMLRKGHHCAGAIVPPAVLAHAVAGLVFQLMCWWVQNDNAYTPADMARMCTSILFDNVEINFEKPKHLKTGDVRQPPPINESGN